MTAGRPPKPVEQKRRTGNPGKRQLPSSSGVLALAPVRPITTDALTIFDEVMAQGVAWLGETDAIALAQLRDMLEEREQLRNVVVITQNNTERRALRELDKQVSDRLSTLGFDPAARARLGLAEVKAASKLEQLRKSREQPTDG